MFVRASIYDCLATRAANNLEGLGRLCDGFKVTLHYTHVKETAWRPSTTPFLRLWGSGISENAVGEYCLWGRALHNADARRVAWTIDSRTVSGKPTEFSSLTLTALEERCRYRK